MSVSSGLVMISAAPQFARPADTTAYASGDLVANSTTAGSVTPLEFRVGRDVRRGVTVLRARIKKSGTSVASAAFRLHLYRRSPTVTNGDNGAWLTDKAADYLGAIDVTDMKAFSDGAMGIGQPEVGSTISALPQVNNTLYGLLEARAGYTPASAETFDITLEGVAD
jgi:hypothetical protein